MLNRFMTEAKVAYGFAERQFILMKRYWMWEVVWLLYGLSMTFAIGFLGVGVKKFTGGSLDTNHLVLYLLTGSLLWGYLSGLFWDISNVVTWERWEGTIEYTFMAPISRVTHIIGMSMFSIIYGMIRTLVTLGILTLFFHLDLSKANLLGALLILVVSSFSFLGFGTMVAVLPLMSPEKGAQMTGIVEGILLMISGVYYETSVLPGWMQTLSAISPATYTLRGMRQALVDGANLHQLMSSIVPLVVMGIILIPLGLLIFQWGEVYCKKTGKLNRSG
jgi:ABC-2 type transport system permease protein